MRGQRHILVIVIWLIAGAVMLSVLIHMYRMTQHILDTF